LEDKVDLKGIIDMHVHTNPDLRIRKYDDFQLLDAGVRVGARAIVIKTHLGSTVERAIMANKYNKIVNGVNDFEMIGSITMNYCVGGINPVAVENALKLGAKVVWLPTQSARNHMVKMNKPLENVVDVVIDGKVIEPMYDIFKLVNKYDAVLGTAHISPEEIDILVPEARKAGVKKLVVTHPEWWVVDMSIEQQERLVKEYDILLERCFAQNMGGGEYKSNLLENVQVIKKVGYKNVLISTDGGQTENPAWEVEFAQYIKFLNDNGISKEQTKYMARELQMHLLNIV
jgi:hypothetical protein